MAFLTKSKRISLKKNFCFLNVQDVDNHNMMSHMNALELSSASQPSPGQAKPTNPSGSSATAGSSDNGDLSVENQAEEDNGWTTVSKGGRRKKGK